MAYLAISEPGKSPFWHKLSSLTPVNRDIGTTTRDSAWMWAVGHYVEKLGRPTRIGMGGNPTRN